MKDLKKYLTEGLLQVTILLSLAGVRVDLDSYLPPIREIILGSSSAYSQIPFHSLRDTWQGPSLHPKSPDLDSFFTARRLLEEVRALGDTRIPRTELSAWLVQVVPGDAEAGAQAAITNEDTTDTSSISEGPSQTGSSSLQHSQARSSSLQHSQTGSSSLQHSQARSSSLQHSQARSSSLQHSHVTQAHIGAAQAEYTKEKPEEKHGSNQDSYDYSYLHNENGKTGIEEALTLQNNGEENPMKGDSDVDLSGSGSFPTETNRNTAEPSLFFEEFIQLLAQTENALEGTSENALHTAQPTSRILQGNSAGELWQDFLSLPDLNISLDDIPAPNPSAAVNPSTQYNVDFTEAVSHDVSLHEAMFASSDTTRRDEDVTQRQESFMQLNSSTNPEGPLSETNLTALFPPMDNSSRNFTNQDLLSGLDENVFAEINLMSLALEEGFDPLEVSQLFEEPDSDSGLSLNSSHSPTSMSISESSSTSFGEDEGATGYSSDSGSVSHDGLEGAVGGSWPEINKFCRIDLQEEAKYYDDVTVQNVHHNHTYNQFPNQVEPSPEHHYSWPSKSGQLRSPCIGGMDNNLSRDERRAKSLRIPFSVDEIVSMPVEMFNNMITKHYLTEAQVSVIRDIRRRGKNKVAAQNCRKRKLDVILNLEDDVCQLRAHKEKLLKERAQCSKSVSHMKQKLNDLYRDVFSKLRDEQGRPVNPSQYALHCNSDGSIMVVPRRLFKSEQKKDNQKEKKQK